MEDDLLELDEIDDLSGLDGLSKFDNLSEDEELPEIEDLLEDEELPELEDLSGLDGLSELDELDESDIQQALGEEISKEGEQDDIVLEDFTEKDEEDWKEELNSQEETIKKGNEAVQTVDMNTTDLGSLLSQLLNNKTIEITIKIKD